MFYAYIKHFVNRLKSYKMLLVNNVLLVSEKIGEQDGTDSIHCQAWSSRVPKMAQPDLDFIGKCKQSLMYILATPT